LQDSYFSTDFPHGAIVKRFDEKELADVLVSEVEKIVGKAKSKK
jgi:hypothetical protein